jgi:hypothetical protein
MQLTTGQRLTLYVAGASPHSSRAVRVVAALVRGREQMYDLTVVDVHRCPGRAHRDGVLTVPGIVVASSGLTRVINGPIEESTVRAKLGLV